MEYSTCNIYDGRFIAPSRGRSSFKQSFRVWAYNSAKMVNTDTVYVEKVATARVEEKLGHDAVDEAKHASDNEHKATFWATFEKHRRAVFWSCIISMTIVMEGYDVVLMYNFWAYLTCEYAWFMLCLHVGSGGDLRALQFRRDMANTTVLRKAGRCLLRGRLVSDYPVLWVASLGLLLTDGRRPSMGIRKW